MVDKQKTKHSATKGIDTAIRLKNLIVDRQDTAHCDQVKESGSSRICQITYIDSKQFGHIDNLLQSTAQCEKHRVAARANPIPPRLRKTPRFLSRPDFL